MDNTMCRCKGCNSQFIPEELWERDELGNNVKFIGFEDLCNTCAQFCWTEESYEEMFSYHWVKPVKQTKYYE